MRILLTGGSGILGQEMLKHNPDDVFAPTHSDLDVRDMNEIYRFIDLIRPKTIIHLAAKTDPPSHDLDPSSGITTNIIGTSNLAIACIRWGIRLVYLSTDYMYSGPGPHYEEEPVTAPSNFIASKLGGEFAVGMTPNHLIIRCSFGCDPFPHEKVYDDQLNSKMYVQEIAPLILEAAQSPVQGILNIGSEGQSLKEYAEKTKPGIESIPTPSWVPRDTRLDISRWKSLFRS
jgi:dTDP-4-dehydrorhamnose reductase